MKTLNWTEAFRRAFASSAAVAGIATVLVMSTGSARAQDAPPPPPQDGGQRQGPGRGPGMGGPMMGEPMIGMPHTAQILNRRDVSKDLNLTQNQRDQIREVMDRAREKMRSMMPPPPGEGGEDGERPDPETMRANMEKAQSEIDKSLAKVLTSDQAARLKEIKIQMAGSSAAADKQIQSELGLSSDQKSQIDAIVKAQRAKMGPPRGGPGGQGGPGGDRGFGGPPPGGGQGGFGGPPGGGQGGDGGFGGPPPGGPGGQGGGRGFGGPGGQGGPGGPNPQMEKAHQELNTAIDAVLTGDQKAALKKLGGTKKFVQEQRPMGGPGGQGGPGGPGGQGGRGGGGGFGGPGGGGPGGGDR